MLLGGAEKKKIMHSREMSPEVSPFENNNFHCFLSVPSGCLRATSRFSEGMIL